MESDSEGRREGRDLEDRHLSRRRDGSYTPSPIVEEARSPLIRPLSLTPRLTNVGLVNPLDRLYGGRSVVRDTASSLPRPSAHAHPIQLEECTLQIPGDPTPLFGWFRENAMPRPDAFYGSDGSSYIIARRALEEY